MSRKTTGRDRYELDLALQIRVRDSYLRQSKQPGWVLVNGELTMSEVATVIAEKVESKLEKL